MFEEKSIQSFDGTKIVYAIHFPKQKKKKTALLFLHGAWGNKSVWSRWFPFFEECIWIAPDLRAHGSSERKNLSMENTVKYLELILKKEKIDEVMIIGNSYGALAAHHFYKQNRAKVKKMVLFSISAKPFLHYVYLIKIISKLGMSLGSIIPSRKKVLIDYATLEHVSASRIWWYDMQGLRFYDVMKILNIIFNEKVDLKTIRIPTLIIEGRSEVLLKIKIIEQEVKNNKNIIFEKMKGTHRLMYKEKLEVIKNVRSFIEQ